MIIGSHNSWSYLPVKKWWMKPITFTAKCQKDDVIWQYLAHGVRCFDLRIRFEEGYIVIAHGLVEYRTGMVQLNAQLYWLHCKGDCIVRVIHEVRNKRQYNKSSVDCFCRFCSHIENKFNRIHFWCGRNLYNWERDYTFNGDEPTCEEKYGSVSNHKWLYAWWPWLYARLHNKNLRAKETDKEILLIDYVNI